MPEACLRHDATLPARGRVRCGGAPRPTSTASFLVASPLRGLGFRDDGWYYITPSRRRSRRGVGAVDASACPLGSARLGAGGRGGRGRIVGPGVARIAALHLGSDGGPRSLP